MITKRKLQRRYLFHYLNVFDQKTDEFFGLLSDITTYGCMLLCENNVKVNNIYNLRLDFPDKIDKPKRIYLDAESKWSNADINPNYNSTGFQFHNISEENKNAINLLIKEYGFENEVVKE